MGVASTPPDQSSQPIRSSPSTGGTSEAILKYPIDMKDDQDRIKFTIWEINKARFTTNSNKTVRIESLEKERGFSQKSDLGTVVLPIQPSITDQNTVDWGSGELNPIEKFLINKSLEGMNKGLDEMVKSFGKGLETLMGNKKLIGDLTGLGQLALVEQAVGVQGLLSRVSGQVLNPNLELLFRGPQLRPFNFSFKLSPRSEREAERVKKIIKFFKKNMAVRKGGEIFLKSPYVFGIEYQKSASELHPSLNLIKKCALQSCSVDYTPLGSYMTYEDSNRTMVSYNISLQFQEIVPIYQDDYGNHPIGF